MLFFSLLHAAIPKFSILHKHALILYRAQIVGVQGSELFGNKIVCL